MNIEKQPIEEKYFDPLTDYGFARLFGFEPHSEVLIHFLNAIFKGEKVIKKVNLGNPIRHGANKENKKVIFDILCTGDQGEIFLVEMQRAILGYMKPRLVYYGSRAISDQLPPGEQSSTYPLKEVYSIALLEFEMPDSPKNDYIHNISLKYDSNGEVFYDKLAYKLIELVKFVKGDEEDEANIDFSKWSDLEKWIYLLKNMHSWDIAPPIYRIGFFKKVLNIAEVSKLGPEEQKMYRTSLQDKVDFEHSIAQAAEDAKKYGIKEGIKEGVELKNHEVVINLIVKLRLSDEQAADVANVSVAYVQKVRAELEQKKD